MQYFKPNWRQINSAINEDNIAEVWKEFMAVEKKLKRKAQDRRQELKEQERKEHIESIKALNVGDTVYYVSRVVGSEIPYGAEGVVHSKARRTRIDVTFGSYTWNCLIENVSINEPSNSEKRLMSVSKRIFS